MPRELTREKAAALRDHFAARQPELLTFVRALVETESPSRDKDGSSAVVSLLANAAGRINAVSSVERIAFEDFGEHLRIRAFAENDAAPIVILGHTDTVHPRGAINERPWRAEGRRIYGPGIFDMKANCALALEVLRACEATGTLPQHPVTILLTCDEESGSPSGRALVEAEAKNARAVLVLEPQASGGRVKTARKGTGMFTVEVHGRAAHAGLDPERGVSAVLELARQTVRLSELNNPATGTTVTVTVVRGGTHSNVVPAEARAEIDLRFASASEGLRVESAIRNLEPIDARAQLVVSGGINRPPLERTDKVAALYAQARALAALLDFDLGEASVGGASDGNFVGALGVPVLDGLGIEGDGAHAAHEHIVVDDIPVRGALLAGLFASL
ncbi:MAG TPA: M20/M25/M40 family metallo-hydrolase [Pyrinomonadaceae bacterium]|nr:M20/M25/M40 family metallo-hydrolase [Pyrinomonadaceae bacterium]